MKKNDNKLVRFAAFVLLITLMALILVFNTFAKYTSKVSGTDTATVAKWSILVNGTDISNPQTEEVDFKLFDTIKDTSDHQNETDVKNGMIAPGTEGSFNIKLENKSDVNAKYKVKFEFTDESANVPLEFKTDSGSEWKNLADINSDEYQTLAMNEDKTVTIYWQWAYEKGSDANEIANNDKNDTKIATTADLADVEVKATIEAVQVD